MEIVSKFLSQAGKRKCFYSSIVFQSTQVQSLDVVQLGLFVLKYVSEA